MIAKVMIVAEAEGNLTSPRKARALTPPTGRDTAVGSSAPEVAGQRSALS